MANLVFWQLKYWHCQLISLIYIHEIPQSELVGEGFDIYISLQVHIMYKSVWIFFWWPMGLWEVVWNPHRGLWHYLCFTHREILTGSFFYPGDVLTLFWHNFPLKISDRIFLRDRMYLIGSLVIKDGIEM